MKNFDFTQASQEALSQVSVASQQILDASQQVFAAQLSMAQENAESAFGLTRSALGVRNAEDAKSFWSDATRATRESFERTTRFVQDLASQQAQAVQDLGKVATSKKR